MFLFTPVKSTIIAWLLTVFSAKAREFGDRMRSLILTNMPLLSDRLHRTSTLDSDAPDFPVEWSWPDAEQRLKEAFERGGFSEWVVAVVREVETEARAEKLKRRKGEPLLGKE